MWHVSLLSTWITLGFYIVGSLPISGEMAEQTSEQTVAIYCRCKSVFFSDWVTEIVAL